MDKIKETLWCYDCEKIFETEDYLHEDHICPECGSVKLYRTSSTSFVYAYNTKEKEKNILEFLHWFQRKYSKVKSAGKYYDSLINTYSNKTTDKFAKEMISDYFKSKYE
jgi:predicted RNA-binding Zn-ribbon protein involved in translation (DUF1610 family)